ncbi:MAG: OsmC family protein [Chloroflexi bacterium]|nr:OsmC family protein [Chloroflexota bacterium]
MEVVIDWKGGMAFEGLADSGYLQKMDADSLAGGDAGAVSPMELIAFGLAGCTGMEVVSILVKKRQPVLDFQIKVNLDRAGEYPMVFSNAVIEYIVTGENVAEAALIQAMKLSAEKYCPVQSMLSKAFPMEMRYKILKENGGKVSAEGRFIPKPVAGG